MTCPPWQAKSRRKKPLAISGGKYNQVFKIITAICKADSLTAEATGKTQSGVLFIH